MNELTLKIQTGSPDEEVLVYSNSLMDGLLGKNKIENQREIVNKILCVALNKESISIIHDDNGAPFLEESPQFISVSHSNSWFAIQRANCDRVGVDIQVVKHDIKKGKHYFVNKREEDQLDLSPQNLNIIWAAKEAAYKLVRGKVERYKESMTVLEINDNHLVIEVNGDKVSCGIVLKNDFVLVYVL